MNHTVICPHEIDPTPTPSAVRRVGRIWIDQTLQRQTLQQVVAQVRRIAVHEISVNRTWDTASIDAMHGQHKHLVTNKETRIAGGLILNRKPGEPDPGHKATLLAVIRRGFGPATDELLRYIHIKDDK